jgi:hypothetical protein
MFFEGFELNFIEINPEHEVIQMDFVKNELKGVFKYTGKKLHPSLPTQTVTDISMETSQTVTDTLNKET